MCEIMLVASFAFDWFVKFGFTSKRKNSNYFTFYLVYPWQIKIVFKSYPAGNYFEIQLNHFKTIWKNETVWKILEWYWN